jgi:F-type H+-transporting ATPase subunit a
VSDAETKKRRPVKRWIVLALIIAGIYCAYLGPGYLKPIPPVVVLPGEPTGMYLVQPFETQTKNPLLWCEEHGDTFECSYPITNTMLATLIADVILVVLALGAWRFAKSGKLVPEGFYNAFEAITEFLWNTTSGATEIKWAKRIFGLVATIFLLIFVANMVKMIPGFETIGQLHESPHGEGYAPVKLFSIGSLDVYGLDKDQPVKLDTHGEDSHGDEAGHAEDAGHHALCEACEVVPFLRGSATDLNFTLALALTTVVMVQAYGVWALGPGYFWKYFPIQSFKTKGPMGGVDLFVGLLEIILEFAKILSFAFRLFGNIFAGALLLSIVGALLPVIIPPALYGFEIFFGTIQAYVFFLLAVVFISGALVSHHDDHSEEHH